MDKETLMTRLRTINGTSPAHAVETIAHVVADLIEAMPEKAQVVFEDEPATATEV